ncbi:FG-GAP repeat domain-containing protein [Pseudohongiella sp.]|uniref:ASPIC/UnbV domain-containing protein n=1 Tax=marine sediment metagenome TaxID=412755 RepID=A0A0F9Z561_9ZZZZ|nr:VCBS repeat-containing protein [Pseudohongiella sp.]HDZ07492.1 hypothetical protein [Pseudohongiella sp.]HEA63003.1 hypothetical protein [Pseudohongiella sp.]
MLLMFTRPSLCQITCLSNAHQKLLPLLVGIAVSGVASDVMAQPATRSIYQAGSIEYGRILLPTDLPSTIFTYFEDVNRDGHTDLVITGFTPVDQPRQGARPGSIMLNNGDNTFRSATGDRPQSEWVREVLVEDFDSDGIDDLFLADHGWDTHPFPGFQNQLMLGTGTGFVDASSRLPVLEDFTHNAAAGDINGDGHIDILVTNNPLGSASERNYFLMNQGDATFVLDRTRMPASLLASNVPGTWAVELADLDMDGHVDLIVGRVENEGSAPSRVYWNAGDGNFASAQETLLPAMSRFVPSGLYAVIEAMAFDLNADGVRDIQLSAYNSSYKGLGTQFLYNMGNRQFVDRTSVCIGGDTQDPSPERETPYFLRLHDINGDGFPELSFDNSRDSLTQSTVFLENSAGGKWRAITRGALSADSEALKLIQGSHAIKGLNQTGYADVFVFDNNGTKTLGMNYLPITHQPQVTVANRFDECSNQVRSLVAANEFGDLDVRFKLIQSEPTIRIQIIPETLSDVTQLPAKSASFNSATGILTMPELHVDDAVAYRNLQFRLIDGDLLIFELVALD